MRNLILAAGTLLATSATMAGQPCQPEYLSAEDVSIMASVMLSKEPASELRYVDNGRANVLYGLRDAYGRVGPEELSQMQSVQPQGARVVYCLPKTTRSN